MPYTASEGVVTVHGYARQDVRNQAPVTNDVTTVMNFEEGYAYGVAGLVAPYIGYAVIFFLVLFFAFSAACCCPKCCCRCNACGPKREVR